MHIHKKLNLNCVVCTACSCTYYNAVSRISHVTQIMCMCQVRAISDQGYRKPNNVEKLSFFYIKVNYIGTYIYVMYPQSIISLAQRLDWVRRIGYGNLAPFKNIV